MSFITALEVQKKDNERINVFVDGQFLCGLTIDSVVKNGLTVGMEVDDVFLASLIGQGGENDMYNKALVYIVRMPRTEIEIRRFLSRKKDCSPEMIDRIVDRLKTTDYINDEAYARMFVGAKHVKVSSRAIKQKLKSRGIKSDIVETATSEIGDQSDLARSVAEKYMRFREYDEKNIQRLFRYMVSKGFEFDLTAEIVSEYKKKSETDTKLKDQYNECRGEYHRAVENLKQAKLEARESKIRYKELCKKIVKEYDA
ncbi:MAG: RecX family transcriptional regulator [Firmicutes bacterium]|nr:RecX family transcriptional regulator [Bacillota bacterium]